MNINEYNAQHNYNEAQLLGQPQREKAFQKIRDGIASFESLEDALCDAEENIQRYTKSDFPVAHFYEIVRDEVLRNMYGNIYGLCETCKWWSCMTGCSNRSDDPIHKEIFSHAAKDYSCEFYYPMTPNTD